MTDAPIGVTVLVSDTHVGGTTALMPPHEYTAEGGQKMKPSRVQLWLWDCWTDFNQHVKEYKRLGSKLFVIVNGDVVEGKHHETYQILTADETMHSEIAIEVYEPLLSNADGCAFVRGTPAHSGTANGLERTVANGFLNRGLVKASGGEKLHDVFKMTLFDTRYNAAHHQRTSKNPRLRINAALAAIEAHQVKCLAEDVSIADVMVRAHTHHKVDTDRLNETTEFISTGCWQLPTEFGIKIAPDDLPDIGGWFIEHYADGRREVKPMFYPILLPNRKYPGWKP